MGTYRNEYLKQEDETLWELHEIRHILHEELKSRTIEEINREAIKKFDLWKKDRDAN